MLTKSQHVSDDPWAAGSERRSPPMDRLARDPKPRLRSHVRPSEVDGTGLVLLCEDGSRLLTTRADRLVVPLIDGRRSGAEIASELVGQVSVAEVYLVVERLRLADLVTYDPPYGDTGGSAYWDALGVPDYVDQPLVESAVEIRVVGEGDDRQLTGQLAELGIQVRSGGLLVVLADDYLRQELADINSAACQAGRPWMLARPNGGQAWLGPFFVPGQTGCWACLAERLRGHRRIDEFLRRQARHDDITPPPPASLPTTRTAAVALLATEIAKLLSRGPTAGPLGEVIALDVRSLDVSRHTLVRRPCCEACGDRSAVRAEPVRLSSQQKAYRSDGGHRILAPESTYDRLRHHVSPITGIVSALEEVPSPVASAGVAPAFTAHHAFTDGSGGLGSLRESLGRVAGGKGVTRGQAQVGALSEALERYSGVFRGDEPRVRARLVDLDGPALLPNDVMCFSERQLASRRSPEGPAAGDRSVDAARRVPRPFDPIEEVEWSQLWSLSADRHVYLPTSCCYYGYADVRGNAGGVPFAEANSNGCAAGNVLEESVLQGFLELVERDAVAIWWYNRLSRPGVDINSGNDRDVAALVRHHSRLGREAWVLDLTTDLQIPVFAALSRRVDGPAEEIVLGFGAHLDPRVALLRALTELGQSLPAIPPPQAHIAATDPRATAVDWWRSATVSDHPYLLPTSSAAARAVSEYADLSSDDLHDDILYCVARASDCGLETLVIDQTRSDVDLVVARVVVPGLRHFWPRFGPGRLYDVPERMGWLPMSLDESGLNPVPIYL